MKEATKTALVRHEDSIAKLKDFCKAYSHRDTEELFCKATLALTRGNYQNLHHRKQALLLDFLEALEKAIPAIYQVQTMMDNNFKNDRTVSKV